MTTPIPNRCTLSYQDAEKLQNYLADINEVNESVCVDLVSDYGSEDMRFCPRAHATAQMLDDLSDKKVSLETLARVGTLIENRIAAALHRVNLHDPESPGSSFSMELLNRERNMKSHVSALDAECALGGEMAFSPDEG